MIQFCHDQGNQQIETNHQFSPDQKQSRQAIRIPLVEPFKPTESGNPKADPNKILNPQF